ncbi:MAG: DUF4398 domain-containing protein [Luteitalea sp.]|nr:DUF4398 domain-containing protein [Luteitalea sp.]
MTLVSRVSRPLPFVVLSLSYGALFLAATLLASACGEPPSKELHQAQGAIDAARAAGAAEYAPEGLDAALDALKRAGDFANQRDYRQALNFALEARERARNAAAQAAEAKARARGNAEKALQALQTRLEHATSLLASAKEARVAPRAVRPLAEAVGATAKVLQEARSALDRDDFEGAIVLLGDSGEKLGTAMDGVSSALVARAKGAGRR